MRKIIVRIVADVIVVAIALFGAAGTLRWWRAWALLAVLLIVRLVGARVVFRVNPALMLERAEPPIQHGRRWPTSFCCSRCWRRGLSACPSLLDWTGSGGMR